jgi:hypothetical protein
MNIIQLIWSVLKRPVGSLGGSFKEDEKDLPLEHDPVGEFLKSKKLATNQSDDEVSDAPGAGSVPSQDGKQPIEANSEGMVSTETGEATVQPAEAQLESPIQSDSKAETPVTMLPPDIKKEGVSQVENAASQVLSETEVVPPGLKSGIQKIEAADMPSTGSPQEDEKIESVLDIFRSEELAINTTNILSKELSDTSIYSLLEESKQIAQIAKKIKRERPE